MIFRRFEHVVNEFIGQAIVRSFPHGFVSEIANSGGIRTMTQPCGCVLKAEHQTDKHMWILTVDYSNCREHLDHGHAHRSH